MTNVADVVEQSCRLSMDQGPRNLYDGAGLWPFQARVLDAACLHLHLRQPESFLIWTNLPTGAKICIAGQEPKWGVFYLKQMVKPKRANKAGPAQSDLQLQTTPSSNGELGRQSPQQGPPACSERDLLPAEAGGGWLEVESIRLLTAPSAAITLGSGNEDGLKESIHFSF